MSMTLQAEYEIWRDQLPESLADSRTAEPPQGVFDVHLDALRDVVGQRPLGALDPDFRALESDLDASGHDDRHFSYT